MAAESAADLAGLFDTNEFADSAVYQLARGGNYALDGIFDAGHTLIEGLGAAAISSVDPVFRVRTADLPKGAAGDAGDVLKRAGVTWKVIDLEPTGDGAVTVITLRR